MMIVLAILGILAALLIPYFMGVLSGSKESTADTNLKLLNQAVLRFNQANWELVLTSSPGSTSDEDTIVRSLQYRGPAAKAAMGSPYLDPMLDIVDTDSADTYRASWNGRMFEMLTAGTSGSGIDLLKMVSTGTEYSFPSGYTPYKP